MLLLCTRRASAGVQVHFWGPHFKKDRKDRNKWRESSNKGDQSAYEDWVNELGLFNKY